jgi:hypothetical protein
MTPEVATEPKMVTVTTIGSHQQQSFHTVELPAYGREYFDDVAFMTSMLLTLLGNYRGSGHFGGPLAYTPYNVALHLAGAEAGGLSYDIRAPKHPFSDKFMLAGGHCIPTCYALWMILYEAMARRHTATGDDRYACDPAVAILSVDALGFRRSGGATALDGARREHRRDQRRERRSVGNRDRYRSWKGDVLGLHRRSVQHEGHRP